MLWFGSSHIAALYSTDHAVITASVPLIALVALFHLFDSLQTQVGYVLRAYKVSTSPMVVYLVAMWGIGIGGGYLLTFLLPEDSVLAPFGTEAHGAMGFWVAGFVSLILATIGLAALLVRLWRREQRTSQAQ